MSDFILMTGGKDPEGNAKSLRTDMEGNLLVQPLSKNVELIKSMTPTEGLLSYSQIYIGDGASSGQSTLNNLDVSKYQTRMIVVRNSHNVPIRIDIIRFHAEILGNSNELARVNDSYIDIPSGGTVIIEGYEYPFLNFPFQYLQIRASRITGQIPTSGSMTVYVYGGIAPAYTNYKDDLKQHTFHSNVTVPGNGAPLDVKEYKTLTVEIYGNNTSRKLEFKGISYSGIPRPISGVCLTDLSTGSETSRTGEIWQFDITGLNQVLIVASVLDGGNLYVTGRISL